MNFSSFVGRLSPGLYVNSMGIENIVTVAAGWCSILILGMIGVKSVAGIIAIAIIYGFAAGVCKASPTSLWKSFSERWSSFLQTSLCWYHCWPFLPMIFLSWGKSSQAYWFIDVSDGGSSARMGIAFAISGLFLPSAFISSYLYPKTHEGIGSLIGKAYNSNLRTPSN